MQAVKSNIREIPYPAAMQHKDIRRSKVCHVPFSLCNIGRSYARNV
nr:MAG TPA: hypothetical protein [Caudoviricetes sp.]